MIRSFKIRDFRLLHRYRHRGLFLDNIPTLTRGKLLIPVGAMLLPLSSALGVFTSVYENKANHSETILSQVSHIANSPYARFSFLAPDSAIESPNLSILVEHLIHQVGERGAQNLIAEVDEKTQTFEVLCRENFSIYARQHIWRLLKLIEPSSDSLGWRSQISQDEINVRKLYNAIVPALVRQVEPSPWNRARVWVYYQGGEMLAFAEVVLGSRGVWVQPFIHPEMENVDIHLIQLLKHLRMRRRRRPIYVCLRSYQAWLSHALKEVDAEVAHSQAVMVRRLTAAVKHPALAPLPQLDGSTEPTTSYYKNGSLER